jgi:hypothetical protein
MKAQGISIRDGVNAVPRNAYSTEVKSNFDALKTISDTGLKRTEENWVERHNGNRICFPIGAVSKLPPLLEARVDILCELGFFGF